MTRRLLTLISTMISTAALVLTAGLVFPASARAPDTPAEVVAVDIGTLGGERTIPAALNDRGQVVGMSQTAGGGFHAFLWQDGVMTDLTPGAGTSAAVDINERGQILGWGGPSGVWVWTRGRMVDIGISVAAQFLDDRGQVVGHDDLGIVIDEAFFPTFWERGEATPLGPGPVPGFPLRSSFAWDLSERGAVLARGLDPSDEAGNSLPSLQPGYVWEDGVHTPIPELLPGPDINTRGVVAGTGAQGGLVWADGVTTLLGAPPGATRMTAEAINDRGEVAGTATGGERALAFVWRDGRFRDLGTPAGVESKPVDINERGDVAGEASFRRPEDDQFVLAGFLARRGTMTLLRTADDTFAEVIGLNDRGMVVGVLGTAGVERGAVWQVTQR